MASWEQPPRKKRRMVRSPKMMAVGELLKRYRGTVSFVTLALTASVAAGVLWGPEEGIAVVPLAILLGTFFKTVYDAWWDSGYPKSGREQWEALVQKQRDKLKKQEDLR